MNRKLFLVPGLFLLLSALLCVRFSPVEVKASNDYPVHNLDTGLDYATIQAAIDAPETLNGHTIRVDAGARAPIALSSVYGCVLPRLVATITMSKMSMAPSPLRSKQ